MTVPSAPPKETSGTDLGAPVRTGARVARQPLARRAAAVDDGPQSRGRARFRAPVVEVLGSGIYLSGTAGLEIGARYGVARVSIPGDDRLRVFGPIDIGQMTVRHDGRLDDFEVIESDDRLIVAGRRGRSTLTVVLRVGGGTSTSELEAILQSGRYLPGW